jgi:GT2 family glycosyltransferase/glycosyltransferase involved in cell wall biosynthesis
VLRTLSIVIPVYNQLEFTRQCLDRIRRNTAPELYQDIIIIDGASTDGTQEYFANLGESDPRIVYRRLQQSATFAEANNVGAGLSKASRLLFLNNDTLVQPHWLHEMLELLDSDSSIGIVGIKQLFPYTNLIYHTGIVFSAEKGPQHLYPFSDASLPHVNKQREYQAVTGSCLLIDRDLFNDCGGFDEVYVNGFEDIDLCMAVRRRGRKVFCCTSAYIYHYGQITRGVSMEDDENAAHFSSRWGGAFRVDDADYHREDGISVSAPTLTHQSSGPSGAPSLPICFVDDLSAGNALTWAIADLASALRRLDWPVHVMQGELSPSLSPDARRDLQAIMTPGPDPDGVQIKWSHHWPQQLFRDLTGRINLELFVINYLFANPGNQPWDYWLQTLRQNGCHKLPLTEFCRQVLLQCGVAEGECHVLPLGYSREIVEVEPSAVPGDGFRFLTVTNSHDPARYGTQLLLDAYIQAFSASDPVTLVVKDYGIGAEDTTLRTSIQQAMGRARIEYVDAFLDKPELIRLYRSCDAFVSAHRGEGFGMKILDAMACGMPVITPLFGGPVDFCTTTNCFPVDFSLSPMGDCLDTRQLRITNQPMWCEPSTSDLRQQLRFVFENPAAARATGDKGRADVIDRFTWENAARRLIQIVEALGERS